MKRPSNHSAGFGLVELTLTIVTVGLLIVLGYIAYTQFFAPEKTVTTQTTQTTTTAADIATDCSVATDKLAANTQWKAITGTKVLLSDWGVSFTIDPSFAGRAVCTEDTNGYRFSLKAVINSDSCRQEYQYNELSSVGLQVIRLSGTSDAGGQVAGATGSLLEYYTAHSSENGNSFVDPTTTPGRVYHKLGNDFIVGFGDTENTLTTYKDARTQACPGVAPDYTTTFVAALDSLHTI